jgi:hypothetical protein
MRDRTSSYTPLGHKLTFCRFAFVEYEDPRDADDAFHDMHGRRFGRDTLTVEVFTPPYFFRVTCLSFLVGQEYAVFVMAV